MDRRTILSGISRGLCRGKTNHSSKNDLLLKVIACEQTHIGAQREHGVAASAKSSGEAARRESEPALISAKFSFSTRNPLKK